MKQKDEAPGDIFTSGPFASIRIKTRDFVLSLCETALFNDMYSNPESRDAALVFLLKDPSLKSDRPN